MNREILEKLDLKDLQHYRNTLIKRIQQLKSFNIELGKDNVELTMKINKIKIQLAKKDTQKINKSNFDFDDLYKLGVNKIGKLATKDGMLGLWSASEQTLRRGLGIAGNIVKKYMNKDNKKEQEDQRLEENIPKKNEIKSTPTGDEEVVNQNADFNSYDIGIGKYFQTYQPKAQQDLQQVPITPSLQEDSKVVVKKSSSASRKKIFDRKQEQIMLAEKKLQRQYYEPDQENQQKQKEIQANNEESKVQWEKQNDFQSQKTQTVSQQRVQNMGSQNQETVLVKKQSQRVTRQTQVEPNEVMDLENDSESQSQNQKQKHLYEHKITQQNVITPEEQTNKNDEEKQGIDGK